MRLAYPVVKDRLHSQAISPSNESVVGVDNRQGTSLGGGKYLSMEWDNLGGLLGEADKISPVEVLRRNNRMFRSEVSGGSREDRNGNLCHGL